MFFKNNKPKNPVKELQQEVSRLRHAIRSDELTLVLNRRGIAEEFAALFEEALYSKDKTQRKLSFKDVALLFFDIDNFKSVNDQFGHDVGDLVLQEFSQTIARNIRGLDRVGRLGGEEFVALLVGASEAEGKKKAEKLLEKIRTMKFGHEKAPEKITASIGVATIESAGAKDLDSLIKAADKAMYEAKTQRGKNTVVAYSEIE